MEIYEYENDMTDFKMPYRLFGKFDEQIMIDRYKKLTNVSRNILINRLTLSTKAY